MAEVFDLVEVDELDLTKVMEVSSLHSSSSFSSLLVIIDYVSMSS